ncbi:DUF3566 domain-containing protein [Streptomyces sp. NPDC048277]|uniref:DUF3566 domain-containing protein n=1 Tax=Streptomyces sp. NPDC048277 TaxID=3155027 RepID=UPI0034051C7A
MTRTKHSRTRSTARKRAPRIASRLVTAPTAPTPTTPEPEPRQPAPSRGHTLPHAPPRRPTRMRIAETNPWSVTVMSTLFLGGLGVCVLGAVLATSVLLAIVAPGEWPSPSETLVIATVVIMLEVLLGTALACLCSFMYNYTARFGGGVEVALTDDVTDAPPAARALQLMTRLQTRARRRLQTFLPTGSPRPPTDADHRREQP